MFKIKILETNIFVKCNPAFMNQFRKFHECFRAIGIYIFVFVVCHFLIWESSKIYVVHIILFIQAWGRQDNCYA